MQDQPLEQTVQDVARGLAARAVPNAQFISSLGQDIYRAAYAKVGGSGPPFHDVVVELRKLVRLLQRTLVPVFARPAFVGELGAELDAGARELLVARQERVRWLMLGGVLGSMLSLVGVLAALLLRRRNGRLDAKRPLGVG
jgi:hypothetical protein